MAELVDIGAPLTLRIAGQLSKALSDSLDNIPLTAHT
jgi:hypothetical protein